MSNWITACKRGFIGGSVASVVSTAALAALGKREAGSAYGPTNAISHWFHGNKAALQDGPSMKYTLTGFAIHHGSSLFWAVLFERFLGKVLDRNEPLTTLEVGAAAAAAACFTDYQLTPRRLHPGYEMRLSKPSLAVVYATFGVGLALGAMLCRRKS